MKEDDNVIVSGMRSILDLEGVTVAHYLQMTPSVMKRMAVLSQVMFNSGMKPYFSHLSNITQSDDCLLFFS